MASNKKKNSATLTTLLCALAAALAFPAGTAAAQDAPPSGAGALQDTPPEGAISSEEDSDYLIGPGDTLNVFVWLRPELSQTVPVRPDGRISTPLVDDMRAVGKTPSQLAADIEEVLSEYVRTPEVTVIVESFVGTFGAQIRVTGQVANPGSVPYRQNMTLLDVLLEVGGLTEFARGNGSRLRRQVDGETEETRIRLKDLLEDGEIDENMRVQPGDMIHVPEAIF